MTFDEQIKWLDDQIKELENIKKKLGDSFIGSNEEINLKALISIRNGYKKAYKDSISLGWVLSPERMA